ncbi:MAG: aconitate hydratase AcnA [Gammaproteobacteria bacterium]|nr:aconitate hydratase AcnA [Gammaproteobacteria bacterium]
MKQDLAPYLTNLTVNNKEYFYHDLTKLNGVTADNLSKLPVTLKILLENIVRCESDESRLQNGIAALLNQGGSGAQQIEISFTPSRVLLQDFTGVPAVVDLAAMRDAMQHLGGDPHKINPLQPVELVIDHSVQVDNFGNAAALQLNSEIEFDRNRERYEFLKWGQQAFANFKVVPPETGIVHQVNLEYLARVAFVNFNVEQNKYFVYPDTLVGTDSHTTMVNGLGVLGWGVGGIEAEAAMLGQPMPMLIPDVIGFELSGALSEGATATDLVLTVVQILRQKGVVGKFVEFYGEGLQHLPVADRSTIANMAPEFGATCGFFPIDHETIKYLRLTGRSEENIALVEQYARKQGLWVDYDNYKSTAVYKDKLVLSLNDVKPSIAGPKRPQDKILLSTAKQQFRQDLENFDPNFSKVIPTSLSNGSIVIAAITSCTNTSNPAVMIAAGLVAKKAALKNLKVPNWVKTSLAPGSKVVTEYLKAANLLEDLEKVGFFLVGYGCTTCIGNSGPLPDEVLAEIKTSNLTVCSVLSGNRNFEARIHPEIKMNYLASPPLVVAYALAGTMDIDLYRDPLGHDSNDQPVYLKDIWPSQQEIHNLINSCVTSTMFKNSYAKVYDGSENWQKLKSATGASYTWQDSSTYVKNPPYFVDMQVQPSKIENIADMRVLAKLGDSVTTDHISPAGNIKFESPAGKYLLACGVANKDFNSYGARRGNHEVMIRGTFANVRLRNLLAPGTEGGVTRYQPSGAPMTIYDASVEYAKNKVPLLILAGKEYGSGSSRDWAAKGPRLLGVRVVIAISFERIHRSNLVGMGILPLEFINDQTPDSLGLTGEESYSLVGLEQLNHRKLEVIKVNATDSSGCTKTFETKVRLDTPQEVEYYRHGGILQYVLRQLIAK